MGLDEAGTLALLNDYKRIMTVVITRHRGRIVSTARLFLGLESSEPNGRSAGHYCLNAPAVKRLHFRRREDDLGLLLGWLHSTDMARRPRRSQGSITTRCAWGRREGLNAICE
jgi:hypothetical protein